MWGGGSLVAVSLLPDWRKQRFPRFFVANLLGACAYVPVAVAIGYAIGYGLGGRIERLRQLVGEIERLALIAAAVMGAALWAWRAARARERRRG